MFKIKYTDEKIVNETGLSIVGKILNDTNFRLYINNKTNIKNSSSIIPTYDIMATYIGCLVQAKSEFARIQEYRNDIFFKQAMMLEKNPPSECIVRQRIDAIGKDDMSKFNEIIDKVNVEILTNEKVNITSRIKDYVPIE